MKNQFGVPVPGWTVLATAFGGAFFALSVIAATVGDFAPIVLLAVGPIAFLGVGLAIRAYVATAESRRQTEVVRAVFGYGRGELLASWRSHLWRIAFFGVAVVWFATSALLGDERYLWGNVVCFGYLWGLFTVSAVQKWRYER